MSRELLKEAAQALETVQHYFPAQDEADKGLAVADVDACQRLMTKIEAYLAEPEPDAMEVLRKVREEGQFNDGTGKKIPPNSFALLDSEAVALIEDYGRRVPRAMLEELAIEILDLADLTWKSGWQEYVKNLLTAIFAKHGVQVEG